MKDIRTSLLLLLDASASLPTRRSNRTVRCGKVSRESNFSPRKTFIYTPEHLVRHPWYALVTFCGDLNCSYHHHSTIACMPDRNAPGDEKCSPYIYKNTRIMVRKNITQFKPNMVDARTSSIHAAFALKR